MTLYGAETWTLRASDKKYLESFEMWYWRRMEKINEQRNILHEIQKRKANWIVHILRRNFLLRQVIEGKIKGEIEVTRRRGRRRKKLLDNLKDRRGYSHLKEEALDRICEGTVLYLSSDRILNEWMSESAVVNIRLGGKNLFMLLQMKQLYFFTTKMLTFLNIRPLLEYDQTDFKGDLL
jgi:hypothetical protein